MSEEAKLTSGGYFTRFNLSSFSKTIEDKNLGSKIWEKSSALVELDQNLSMEYIL